MNLIDAIRHHARVRPYDLAVVHPAGAVNYLQLAGVVENVGRKLLGQGIAPGMAAALYVSDPFVHLVLALAGMHNGTPTISAHPNHDPIPAATQIDAYVVDRALPFATTARCITAGPDWLGEVALDASPALAGTGFPDEHAICRMYTSSGTTGVPKVIGHSTANLESMATRQIAIEPLIHGPNLSTMWLSTIGGFGAAQATLWHGCMLVMATSPLMVLRFINLYKVVFLRTSPQQLQRLLEAAGARPVRFPSLQRIEVSGAATPRNVVLSARAVLCPNVVGNYGSTEAGLVAQAPPSLLYLNPGTAGYVVPKACARIVDENDQPLPAGTEGIVQVRTPDMSKGYVGDAAATAAAFRKGWFAPGDLGTLSADGLLHITGRADEMINAGGVKLSPSLVDEFLLGQPGVREAAAFAHTQLGESDQVWAAVVCGEGFDEAAVLHAAAAALNSRAPVRLLRVTEIPRNEMGKPLRRQLAEVSGP